MSQPSKADTTSLDDVPVGAPLVFINSFYWIPGAAVCLGGINESTKTWTYRSINARKGALYTQQLCQDNGYRRMSCFCASIGREKEASQHAAARDAFEHAFDAFSLWLSRLAFVQHKVKALEAFGRLNKVSHVRWVRIKKDARHGNSVCHIFQIKFPPKMDLLVLRYWYLISTYYLEFRWLVERGFSNTWYIIIGLSLIVSQCEGFPLNDNVWEGTQLILPSRHSDYYQTTRPTYSVDSYITVRCCTVAT